jgi:hypothetical protein
VRFSYVLFFFFTNVAFSFYSIKSALKGEEKAGLTQVQKKGEEADE